MLLGQASLESVPASFVKYAIILLIVAVVVSCLIVGAILGILQYFQSKSAVKEPQSREVGPQPFEVTKAPKRYNKDLDEQRHTEIDRRLTDHDRELNTLWETLREEDEATRKELREAVVETNRALGRIEGALGTSPAPKVKA